jgi:hypothetical protein
MFSWKMTTRCLIGVAVLCALTDIGHAIWPATSSEAMELAISFCMMLLVGRSGRDQGLAGLHQYA